MKNNLNHRIPVIDLFAGPGGLVEGFSASKPAGWNVFKICLSIEKDLYAHRTLELRNFFRQFSRDQVPEEYYSYLRKEITRDELFEKYPSEGEAAKEEAWHAELGSKSLSECEIDKRIKKAYTSYTIIEQDARFFAGQRNVPMSLPFSWKFPGDKIKSGEIPFKFLRWEILEELGMGK